jgi:hypothetical protein
MLVWMPVTSVVRVVMLPVMEVTPVWSVVRSAMIVFWLVTVAIPLLTVKSPMLEAVKLVDELDTAAPTRYEPVAAVAATAYVAVYTYRPPGLGDTLVAVKVAVVVEPAGSTQAVTVPGADE